ncbi:transmembrane E3 ubiquitin-protein ligase FLY1-like isoform X3 [Lycium barbarum]|uniref:transmembrane E3 ubiquitin-protein ligase FLY1-like isoform X3 n=1 Tax=Lycium barbarum TaxID=112863 RepID=UPI00293EE59E|nr:transmembrane E3 ubiquitin-protein ligase FLY1-like isoform X3 [Lycium barbarum]
MTEETDNGADSGADDDADADEDEDPDGAHDHYRLEGLMESPSVDAGGDCFSPMLLNATSVNIEVYYNKAVNYTLMVTFIAFLQVLLLIRQMEHSNTHHELPTVLILMIGKQAIMDA